MLPSLDTEKAEDSYLYNYIRFYTKHGDVKILTREQSFAADKVKQFSAIRGVKAKVALHVWHTRNNRLQEIPAGFPYLSNNDTEQVKSPIEVAQLKEARFYARYAKHLYIDGNLYSFIFVIDGYRRALEKYKSLGRQRKPNSGIRLSDQRGPILCSEGIKILPYPELFNELPLKDYDILQETKSQIHYTLFIDGSFSLVTNRTSLTGESIEIIRSSSFLAAIVQFLNECYNRKDSLIFKQLVSRLNKENQELERDKQAERLNQLKKNIKNRERFSFPSGGFVSQMFNQKSLIVPDFAEEHWVGALYIMLAHLVPDSNEYKELWIRPLTFSARGIDSIGSVGSASNFDESSMRTIEYKFQFSSSEQFNHPLDITNYIVAWQIHPNLSENKTIQDDFQLSGIIKPLGKYPLSLAGKITDIKSKNDDTYPNDVVIIQLKELIRETFHVTYRTFDIH